MCVPLGKAAAALCGCIVPVSSGLGERPSIRRGKASRLSTPFGWSQTRCDVCLAWDGHLEVGPRPGRKDGGPESRAKAKTMPWVPSPGFSLGVRTVVAAGVSAGFWGQVCTPQGTPGARVMERGCGCTFHSRDPRTLITSSIAAPPTPADAAGICGEVP